MQHPWCIPEKSETSKWTTFERHSFQKPLFLLSSGVQFPWNVGHQAAELQIQDDAVRVSQTKLELTGIFACGNIGEIFMLWLPRFEKKMMLDASFSRCLLILENDDSTQDMGLACLRSIGRYRCIVRYAL